jgi:hypothetical protein
MTAMLIGTALALAALTFVLYPLFQDTLDLRPARPRDKTGGASLSAVDALREIEFDHATGKLSEHDYAELKSSYTQRAVAAMRNADDAVVVCGTCGPRPEPNAAYCSECGRQLVG